MQALSADVQGEMLFSTRTYDEPKQKTKYNNFKKRRKMSTAASLGEVLHEKPGK